MLTNEEKQLLHQAINAAIKSSPDAIAAASVLLPLLQKICMPIEQQPSQT
jgi:HPt (histidine-containing phosphotransfer) domain-containing protein